MNSAESQQGFFKDYVHFDNKHIAEIFKEIMLAILKHGNAPQFYVKVPVLILHFFFYIKILMILLKNLF